MADNGWFSTNSYSGMEMHFNWGVGSYHASENYTVVNWNMQAVGGDDGPNIYYMCGPFYCEANGAVRCDDTERKKVFPSDVVESGSFVVYHDDSGNASFGAYISAAIYSYETNVSGSGSFTLPSYGRYTVSYSANGGSSTPGNQVKKQDVGLALASGISRTGYTFNGWAGSDGNVYSAGSTFTGNYALNLTARWIANTYTISYNANGGSSAPSAQTKTYDSSLTLTTVAPTRTGYTFSHWNTASNNSGTSYNSGQSFTSNITSNITLYAIWTANNYTISYSANGGSEAPGSQTKTYDSSLTLTTAKPSRVGYTFVHWNTNVNNTGTTYDSGATFSTNITSSITLYAIWSANSYTVTYDANGGTGAPSAQTKVYDSALNFSSTAPTKTLAIFASWNTLSNGSGISYAPGTSIPNISSNLTVYAIWTPQYEITYSSNTSDTVTNLPTKQIKTYNQNISLSSSVPVRNLYNFISWNTSSSNTGTDYAPGATYSTNAALTLYAIWKLAYILPSFTNVPTAIHSDKDGKATDDGTYINATVKWSVDRTIDSTNSGYSIQIDWKSTESSTYPAANTITKTISGVSGTTDIIFGAGAISSEITYDIKISLLDSYSQSKLSSAQKTITYIQIQNSSYAFDIYKELNANNYHACIGGPARDANVIDIKYGGSSMTAVSKTGAMTVKTSVTAPTFNGALNGNATTATTATTALSCSGNAATATTASSCTGNSATATTASSCTGNSATATTASSCTGNSATATTASMADCLTGFHSKTSGQTWGQQAGTFVTGFDATNGSDIAFRRDCPTTGQLSVITDGRFYQNEGNYRCLDTSDILNSIYPVGSIYLSVGSTSPASLFGGTWVNLTDTWRFPLIGPISYSVPGTGGSLTTGSTTLSANQSGLRSHGHTYRDYFAASRQSLDIGLVSWSSSENGGSSVSTNYEGGWGAAEGHTHSLDWQPFITIHGWRRTA